jgi:formylglycine-generating enzyme required for sulfatase activity
MVLIQGGKYVSGIDPSVRKALVTRLGEPDVSFYASELPRVVRDLDAFYIDVYEVTNERYGRFASETHRALPAYYATATFGRPRQPVVGVGWPDAEAFCAWAGKRLPTEFEWEKAARGSGDMPAHSNDNGANDRMWPWGAKEEPAYFNGRYTGQRAPVEVGSYPAGMSPYGLFDMSGNVWEMTSSHWPKDGSPEHTMKGGSFLNTYADVRVTARWAADDEIKGATWLGFRCAMPALSYQKSATAMPPTEAELDFLSGEYAATRARMKPGPLRTQAMQQIVDRMRRLRPTAYGSKEIRAIYDDPENVEGARIAGLALVLARPAASDLPLLLNSVRYPVRYSAFEQYQAIVALESLLPSLPRRDRDAVREALNDAWLHNVEHIQTDTSRSAPAQRLLKASGG